MCNSKYCLTPVSYTHLDVYKRQDLLTATTTFCTLKSSFVPSFLITLIMPPAPFRLFLPYFVFLSHFLPYMMYQYYLYYHSFLFQSTWNVTQNSFFPSPYFLSKNIPDASNTPIISCITGISTTNAMRTYLSPPFPNALPGVTITPVFSIRSIQNETDVS